VPGLTADGTERIPGKVVSVSLEGSAPFASESHRRFPMQQRAFFSDCDEGISLFGPTRFIQDANEALHGAIPIVA